MIKTKTKMLRLAIIRYLQRAWTPWLDMNSSTSQHFSTIPRLAEPNYTNLKWLENLQLIPKHTAPLLWLLLVIQFQGKLTQLLTGNHPIRKLSPKSRAKKGLFQEDHNGVLTDKHIRQVGVLIIPNLATKLVSMGTSQEISYQTTQLCNRTKRMKCLLEPQKWQLTFLVTTALFQLQILMPMLTSNLNLISIVRLSLSRTSLKTITWKSQAILVTNRWA